MFIEEAVRSFLLANSGVSALVSTRIWPVRLRQNPTFPALTYNRISTVTYPTHQGSPGVETVRIQFDCWAIDPNGPLQALALAKAVEGAIEFYQGQMGGLGGVRVGSVFHGNLIMAFEPETQWYHAVEDFEISYST